MPCALTRLTQAGIDWFSDNVNVNTQWQQAAPAKAAGNCLLQVLAFVSQQKGLQMLVRCSPCRCHRK
jgi:hypothetical protein